MAISPSTAFTYLTMAYPRWFKTTRIDAHFQLSGIPSASHLYILKFEVGKQLVKSSGKINSRIFNHKYCNSYHRQDTTNRLYQLQMISYHHLNNWATESSQKKMKVPILTKFICETVPSNKISSSFINVQIISEGREKDPPMTYLKEENFLKETETKACFCWWSLIKCLSILLFLP